MEYKFEKAKPCKSHKKYLIENQKEIIKWMLKSKVSPEEIALFTKLNLSNRWVRRHFIENPHTVDSN